MASSRVSHQKNHMKKCKNCGKTLKEEDIGATVHHRLEGIYCFCKKCAKKLREKEGPEEYIEKLEKE